MIIRSQDGKTIINLANADTIKTQKLKDKCIIEYYVDGNYAGYIAVYTTEEKAIKVLDMMCKHNFWNENAVFYIPKDSEE